LPCIDNIENVDLRTISLSVAPQEILTKDSVTITVDAVCYYRIYNPIVAVINIENSKHSTGSLAATTLRNILGTSTLHQILQNKESISLLMQVSQERFLYFLIFSLFKLYFILGNARRRNASMVCFNFDKPLNMLRKKTFFSDTF
jgi:hypothetical protein